MEHYSNLFSLISLEDKKELKKYIKENGYYSVEKCIDYIKLNHINSDYTCIDVDIIITLDLYIDQDLFITSDDVYDYETLIKKFDFNHFDVDPKDIFTQQKIQVIGSDYCIYNEEENKPLSNNNINDLLDSNIYNTKIYIGKEPWKDFEIMLRFHRSTKFIKKISDTKLIK